MYHDITEDATRSWGPWRYAVTPDSFAADIERVDAGYTVVTMDDVLACTQETDRHLPERAAVITFDDGYENTLNEALPVLERHGVPATVYISSGLIGSSGTFAHRLADGLRRAGLNRIELPDLGLGLPDDLPTDHQRAYEMIRRELKWASPEARETLLKAIESDDGTSPAPMLTGPQISRLADHPLTTVGAHGHDHVPLTALSDSQLRGDIERASALVAEAAGRTPVHFSYPFGAHDRAVRLAVRRTGFRTAVATDPKMLTASRVADQRLSLPRVDGALYGSDWSRRETSFFDI